MSDLYLSEDEIKHITAKTHKKAQREALSHMGYLVKERPDGSFWVPRSQFNAEPHNAKQKKANLNFGALRNNGQAA